MKLLFPPHRRSIALALLLIASHAHAANNWTPTTSGLWRTAASWSLGTAPSNKSNENPVQITNGVSKTITIDSATASGNLAVRGLTVSAPVGATNTLALVNATAPLTTSNPFLLGNRAVLAITNSTVSPSDTFDVLNSTVILQSGSLNCPVNCDLQSGEIIVNGGTLNATTNSLLGTTGIRMGRFSGANASLILNGGTVNAERLTMGSVIGSANSLTIAGGALNLQSDFSAGQLQSTTANVTITSGSLTATNGFSKIADRSAAAFNQSGGSVAFGDLTVGDLGVGTYNFTAGNFSMIPFAPTNFLIIGNLENGDFNQSGGTALIHAEIHVADFAGVVGNLNLTGGQFIATNDLIAIGREGTGSMLINNATAVFTNTSVGRHLGASGSLTVQNNANLAFIGDLSIGRLSGSSGTISIEGGLVSITNDDLWIGRAGTGSLTMTGGTLRARRVHVGDSEDGIAAPNGSFAMQAGNFSASSNLVVGTPQISTGTFNLSGGSITVTNLSGTAQVQISAGTAIVTGGTLTTDKLLINDPAATFTFNNGTIRAKSMLVSNGQPFTVGDGINPAVLELQGGTFTFANGLVIAPNATVTGCGTIIGSIVNNGTYNNPCGGAVTPSAPSISGMNHSAQTAVLSCVSQSGFTYTLEYKNALTDPTWTAILPAATGTGGVLNLTDLTATNSSRFYRIRVQ